MSCGRCGSRCAAPPGPHGSHLRAAAWRLTTAILVKFYVGNWDAVLTEAELARVDDAKSKAERDFFVQRALLAKGECDKVLKTIPESAPQIEMRALRLVAVVASPSTSADVKNKALTDLKLWTEQDATNNASVAVMAGTAFFLAGDHNEALRALRGRGQPGLEAMHLSTCIYLSVDRVDAANRVLEQMIAKEEDSTLTQLSEAWVYLALGGKDLYRDAVSILQDLIGKWQATPMLVGALSAVLMQQDRLAEADKVLAQCLDAHPEDASLVVSRIACAQHSNVSPIDWVTKLKSVAPNHAWFKNMVAQAQVFDAAAKTYVP